jgi:hypothetical protein
MSVPPNLVQSIRAFRVAELQRSGPSGPALPVCAPNTGVTKQQVLGLISEAFQFPKGVGKNFDGLRETLTETMFKAGTQTGFLIVLEQLPNAQKFDKEARETLLDVFRDAADYWADEKCHSGCFTRSSKPVSPPPRAGAGRPLNPAALQQFLPFVALCLWTRYNAGL